MSTLDRVVGFARSVLDPRIWAQGLRILHFYGYSNVAPRARMRVGPGVRLAPNISIRNGERIEIGEGAEIGERCFLWAGDHTGRIVIDDHALFAPEVMVTASNYRYDLGEHVMDQPKDERDVHIGRDVWLGVRVVVTAGVTIGDGCIVAAGSVVTSSLPPYSVAAGVPAKVIKAREITHDDGPAADTDHLNEPAR